MFKKYLKSRQKTIKFLSTHVEYNAFVHLLSGIGVGILITYPFVGPHPVRWGLAFVALGILGHLYPLIVK